MTQALHLSITDDFLRGMSMAEIADARSMDLADVEDIIRQRMLKRRADDLRRKRHRPKVMF